MSLEDSQAGHNTVPVPEIDTTNAENQPKFLEASAFAAHETSERGFLSERIANLKELSNAVGDDIRESDSPWRTRGLGALAIGTQVFDRVRIIILLAPQAVVATMEQTNNPWLAGFVGAGIYAGANYTNGEALTQGLAAYPKTTETFNQKYPGVVSLFEQSLPGLLDGSAEKTRTQEQHEKNRKLGAGIVGSVIGGLKATPRKLGLHVRRSMAGISLGSTAFVATESTRGSLKRDVRKTNAKVTADGAAGVFALGAGMTWSIRELAIRGQMETADKLQSVVENRWTWYGVAALSIMSEYSANRRKNRKIREEQAKNTVATDSQTDILE